MVQITLWTDKFKCISEFFKYQLAKDEVKAIRGWILKLHKIAFTQKVSKGLAGFTIVSYTANLWVEHTSHMFLAFCSFFGFYVALLLLQV